MNKRQWLGIVSVFFALGLVLVLSGGTAQAQEVCNDGTDNDGDKLIDCKDPDCAKNPICQTPTKGLCHNIGGPNGLGANCDGADECAAFLEEPLLSLFNAAIAICLTIPGCDPDDVYAGIFVPHSDSAFNAHVNHGDGQALLTFERLHDPQPHVSANVDCFGVRVFEQPPEPGN